MDDNNVIGMPREKFRVSDLLGTAHSSREADAKSTRPAADADAVTPEAEERTDPLPQPGDNYRSHGRLSSKPRSSLFLVGKDFLPDGFAYHCLERVRMVPGEKPGAGPVMVLRFGGTEACDVLVEGRLLHPLCNLIGEHRLPWLWEHPSPGDFGEAKSTLIRRIVVRPVKQ